MANKKTLVRFNVQNVKYAVPTAQGSFGAFQDMGTSMKLALENDSSVKKIYGDGRRIVHIVNEKGKTATLTQNNVCDAYEIAMGRKIKTKQGLADIKQVKNISHVIYFETCGIDEDGATVLAKTMLYGVTSTRPAESFDQTTDDINESSFDTALEIGGTPLLAANGQKYLDDKGNEVIVWQMTVTPDDIGLKIKGNWQVWKLNSRPIDFVGYRFYKNKTVLRKRIFFRLCRRVRKVSKTGYTTPRQAMSLLSLIGWLSHINGRNFYKKNIYPHAPKNKLKKIVSNYSKQNGGNLKNGKRKTKSIQQRQMARNGKRGQGGGDTHSTRN